MRTLLCLLALAAAAPASAQSPDPVADPTDCTTPEQQTKYSARFAEEKLAIWQQRLKLDQWKIVVNLTRRSDLKPKTLGGIRWDKRKKTAVISVLDPAEYRLRFDQILEDIELTIVHELVHLQLAALPRSEASRSNEEHAVNRMAEALVSLARQK